MPKSEQNKTFSELRYSSSGTNIPFNLAAICSLADWCTRLPSYFLLEEQ